ncbi:MAG TPA: acyltransferase family protein [Pseudolabrys sp.]|nr:acyltransferase family protein [Pseudolabrys sp.]
MTFRSTLTTAAADRRGEIAWAFPQTGRLAYVDGMRAIAIIAIVAFHARIPGFQGGFVGVDIFFVISGFLITHQIVSQALSGHFSAKDFYARRMLRILPPLLLVTTITLAIAPFFPLLPHEARELANSAAATAVIASNYYFTSGTDYFATKSEIIPLLHTWSLGVEEQYYLLAPAFIGAVVAISERRKRRPLTVLAISGFAVVAGSYIVLAILTKTDHRLAFFSIMSRAWQFSLGGGLAISILDGSTVPAKARTALGIVGILAIAISVFFFDAQMRFPGLVAGAIPTLGSLLLLASGLGNAGAPLTRVLASRPAVTIGALSYSWYLWHWPLTAFARTLPLAQDNIWKDVLASTVALVLSVPTYLIIEQPMKRLRRPEITRRFSGRIILAGIGGSLLVAVFALTLAHSLLFVREPPAIALGSPSKPVHGCRADGTAPVFRHVVPCIVGAGGDPRVAYWGDSHALMLAPLAEWATMPTGNAAAVLGKTSCPPLLGVEVDYFVTQTCAASNDQVFEWLKNTPSITGAVLAARWVLYSGRETPDGEADVPHLLWRQGNRASDSYAEILRGSLSGTLEALSPRRVLIVAPVPELRHAAVNCLVRAQISALPRETCAAERAMVEQRRRETVAVLRQVSAAFPNVKLIDPLDVFCNPDTCRPFGPEGVYYSDADHLSPLGAELLFQHFERDFLWVSGGR